MKKYLYCRFKEKEKNKELRGHWDQKADSDKMGDQLKEYREVNVTIPYDSKDGYKVKYFIRWNPNDKSWITSQKISEMIEMKN